MLDRLRTKAQTVLSPEAVGTRQELVGRVEALEAELARLRREFGALAELVEDPDR